jgi:hypothetical protein
MLEGVSEERHTVLQHLHIKMSAALLHRLPETRMVCMSERGGGEEIWDCIHCTRCRCLTLPSLTHTVSPSLFPPPPSFSFLSRFISFSRSRSSLSRVRASPRARALSLSLLPPPSLFLCVRRVRAIHSSAMHCLSSRFFLGVEAKLALSQTHPSCECLTKM